LEGTAVDVDFAAAGPPGVREVVGGEAVAVTVEVALSRSASELMPALS
jgi:hypothetical protein